MNQRMVAFAVLTFSSSPAFAAEVPHTFSANTPAVAAEVNANFSSLVQTVTAIEAAVASLEASTSALEARTSKLAGVLSPADIPGTYAFQQLIVSQRAATGTTNYFFNGWIRTEHQVSNGTFTLLGDGSCMIDGAENHFSVAHQVQTLAELGQFDDNGNKTGDCAAVQGCRAKVDGRIDRDETNGAPGVESPFRGPCTWALKSNVLSVDPGDDLLSFQHAAGGRLFTQAKTGPRDNGREYSLLLLMKTD